MVLIHLKKTDTEQFIYETTCATTNDALIVELVRVWNMRIAAQQLASAAKELAKHGPSREEGQRGLDDESGAGGALAAAQAVAAAKVKGEHFSKDPHAQRTGAACSPALAETLTRCAQDLDDASSHKLADRRQPLTIASMQERMDNVRGAVMMSYPMGLPSYDPVRMILDSLDNLADTGLDVMNADSASLWWAGKEFVRGKTVGDRVGKNEKTKIVCRLQPKSAGAPVREPAVSEDERKAMMSHYFKKQEERKALQADDEDSSYAADWADPKGLKKSLLGTGGVRMGGLS